MGTWLVTGANRGIGLDICRQLRARGEGVIAVCRKSSPALEELRVRIEVGVDVEKDEPVRGLGRTLAGVPIDVIVNNAGILERHSLDDSVMDSIRHQFEVNALGPLRVTAALLSNLRAGSKIAFVTSRMGSIADNESGGHYGYRMSKAALNMAGVTLARDLRSKNIAVVLVHPGYVRTEMTAGQGSVAVAEAALGIITRIDALTMATTGTFWHAAGEQLPW